MANVYFVEQLLKGRPPYYSILSTISLMYAPNPDLSFLWKYDAYNGSAYCQLTIFQFRPALWLFSMLVRCDSI